MKAVLELEAIADDLYEFQRLMRQGKVRADMFSDAFQWQLVRYGNKKLKPWVAKITITIRGLQREFVRYQMKDYSHANSSGSRGVYIYYVLSDGLYEVNERVSKTRAERYFLRVEGDTKTRVPSEEILRWVIRSV
jgi:hypothetical protein